MEYIQQQPPRNNVMNTSNVVSMTSGTATGVSSGTTVINSQYCSNCNTYWYPWEYHQCPTYFPQTYVYPSPVTKTDEVAELKAWIDGFMTNRKMTDRNLKIIKDKLDEFLE